MLPISLEKFEPTQWRSLEKQLIAIAAKEKRELEPRDRLVNNALALAQYKAKNREWKDLYGLLESKGIIKQRGDCSLLHLLTAQKMARLLVSAPPRPKPQPRPKDAPPKPKGRPSKASKQRYSPTLFYFFLCFLFWLSIEAKSQKQAAMFFSLTYVHSGYPRLKGGAKIGANVRKVLLAFSANARRPPKASSTKVKAKQLNLIFDQILTDKLQDCHVLYHKFCQLVAEPMSRTQFDDRLKYRSRKGDIYSWLHLNGKMAFYATKETSEFASEWIPLADAYEIAVANGCKSNFNSFSNRAFRPNRSQESAINYFLRYGLEYRFQVPKDENQFLRWRKIN